MANGPTGTPDAREDFTKRQLVGNAQTGWKATRVFSVANAKQEAQALAAPGIPTINQVHPLSPYLVCDQIGAEGVSQYYWIVTVTYRQYFAGLQDNTNPLRQPCEMRWRVGNHTEKIDQDIFGNAIRNTAGLPFKSEATHEAGTLFLTITRNEPFFDVSTAVRFQNTVNSKPWSPCGAPALLPGQARCVSICPTKAYTRKVKYLPIAYEFEMRSGNGYGGSLPKADPDGFYDGFKLVVVSQGKVAYTTNKATGKRNIGEIVDSNGNQLADEVLLDENGQPITPGGADEYQIALILNGGSTYKSPSISVPDALRSRTGDQIIVQSIDNGAGGKSVLVKYWRNRKEDFNQFSFI